MSSRGRTRASIVENGRHEINGFARRVVKVGEEVGSDDVTNSRLNAHIHTPVSR